MLNLKMINTIMTEEIIRTDYDLACGDRYRQEPKGDSTPTMPKWQEFERQRKAERRKDKRQVSNETPTADTTAPIPAEPTVVSSLVPPVQLSLSPENEVFVRAVNEYYHDGVADGHRHETFISELAAWPLLRTLAG